MGQRAELSLEQRGFTGNIHDALRYVAITFHVPLIAECYSSSKFSITIPSDLLDGKTALAKIVNKGHLKLHYRGELAYVFDEAILHDKRNQLNHSFARFDVPADADLFLMILPSRLHNDVGKQPGDPSIGGFAISGIANPNLKGRLHKETLESITARDLLLKEAASLSFWAVISYPPEKTHSEQKAAFPVEGFWSWGDIPPKSL